MVTIEDGSLEEKEVIFPTKQKHEKFIEWTMRIVEEDQKKEEEQSSYFIEQEERVLKQMAQIVLAQDNMIQ